MQVENSLEEEIIVVENEFTELLPEPDIIIEEEEKIECEPDILDEEPVIAIEEEFIAPIEEVCIIVILIQLYM